LNRKALDREKKEVHPMLELECGENHTSVGNTCPTQVGLQILDL